MLERTGNSGVHKHGLMKVFLTVSLVANVLLILVAGDSTMSMLRLKQVVSTKAAEINTLKNDLRVVNDQAASLLSRAQASEGALVIAREELLKVATPDGKARPLPSTAFKYAADIRPDSGDAVHVRSFSEPNDIGKQYVELAPAIKACDKRGELGLDICVVDMNANTDFMDVLVVWPKGALKAGDVAKLTNCLKRQPHIRLRGDRTEIDWVSTARYPGPCLSRPET
jgi:hypothetical protein